MQTTISVHNDQTSMLKYDEFENSETQREMDTIKSNSTCMGQRAQSTLSFSFLREPESFVNAIHKTLRLKPKLTNGQHLTLDNHSISTRSS